MRVYEIAKKYYDSGLWSIERLKMLVEAEKLTADEYAETTGEKYLAKDINSMTKSELLDYAEDHGVEGVSSAMRKDEIIEAISEAFQ